MYERISVPAASPQLSGIHQSGRQGRIQQHNETYPDVKGRTTPIPSPSADGLDVRWYIRDGCRFSRQTAPRRWVNMNALTVISVAALVASSSASLLAYNGVYGGHHGLLGAYPYAGYSGLHPYSYADRRSYTCILQRRCRSSCLQRSSLRTCSTYPVSVPRSRRDRSVLLGYAGGPSTRAETRDAFGVVRGSYNYVDSEGKVQTQHYVADALGFRVSGTNLPVAPDAPVTAPLAALPGPLPEPVQDTPEVAAAKAAHQQAYDEAAAAAAAAPDTRKKRSVLAAPGLGVYSPLRFSYGFSTPLHYAHPTAYASPLHYTAAHPTFTTYNAAHVPTTYAAAAGPALRDAELFRVVHNPGHATSYRVLN
nr:uncharacterized protein LOC113813094 [Penaeus vannamei]